MGVEEEYSGLIGQLNKETQLHSVRVGHICKTIAPALGLDQYTAHKIGYLHDVGKMYIPSRVIKKNGSLNEMEREIVDLHAYFGYRMLKDMGEPSIIYMPILFHHGYWKPKLHVSDDEVIGEMAIKYTCLVHSADVYDAMTSQRCYHEPFAPEQVFNILASDILAPSEIIEALKEMPALDPAEAA